MTLNQHDPLHVSLIELAVAASKLVDNLHDYQHFLGGHGEPLFSLEEIERDYRQIELAMERFRVRMTKERSNLERGGGAESGNIPVLNDLRGGPPLLPPPEG